MVLAQGRGRKPNGTTSWANEPWLTGAQQEDEDTFWGAPSPSPRRRAEPLRLGWTPRAQLGNWGSGGHGWGP